MRHYVVIIAEWYNSFAAMRSFLDNKLLIIVLSVLALGALLGLATGMSSISFRQAQDFGRPEAETGGANPADLIRNILSVPLQTQVMFWGLLVALFLLIAILISPEARKRLIRALIRAFFTYWLLYLIFTRYPLVLSRLSAALTPGGNNAPTETSNSVPPPAFAPPSSTSWMTYLVSLVMVGVVAYFTWRAYAAWRRLHTLAHETPGHKLARIARASLHDLASGRDSTDVILNCYYRMGDVVAEKRNLNRAVSTTPQEFAERLQQAGLPGEAVKQLTRLFESVRYGGQRSSPVMVNEAVACLTTILHYCGETV